MKRFGLLGVLLFIGVVFIFFNFSWNQEFKKVNGFKRTPSFIKTLNSPWAKSFGLTYGNFSARSIQKTIDGGYVVLSSHSLASMSIESYISKITSSGDVEWVHSCGGIFDSIVQTTDSGILAAGYCILKLDPSGNIEWQWRSDDEEFDSAQQTSDGGYILAGRSASFSDGRDVLWIIKLFLNGEIDWQKLYDGIDIEETNGSQIRQTSDGGYIVVGTIEVGKDNFLILKFSPTGDIEWQRKFGSESSNEDARDVCQADDGGFVIAGTTSGLGVESDNSRFPASNFLVIKITPDGNLDPCSYLGMPDLYDTNTFVQPIPSFFSLENIDLELRDSTVTLRERTLNSSFLCWTLNQPPFDVSLSSGINRSLFRKELCITITWNPNPFNEGFVINKYRIYRKPQGRNEGPYQLIGEIPVNTFKFADQFSDLTIKYLYVLTSVDSNGNESPRSISVGN